MLGRKPRRIDVLTGISGVSFEAAWAEHILAPMGDVRIPVIGRDALLANKKASGRAKDRLDIELLAKHENRRPSRKR